MPVPPGELGLLVSLGLDIPVNTAFFKYLLVVLVTQQYNLYLGLLVQTVYPLLHPLQSFQQLNYMPGFVAAAL